MRRNRKNVEVKYFQQELSKTKQALFRAKSVKEARFLQNKFNYLKAKMRELRRRKVGEIEW
jgi:hypothetical protein